MNDVGLRPLTRDDVDWLVQQHGELYARDEGFDDSFPVLVRQLLEDFLANFDPECEASFIAEHADGRRLGSIFCTRKDSRTAKLRMFLLVPEARGLGLGKRLLEACMGFARGAGYAGMELWTHESHLAACALYRAYGWHLVRSEPVHSFGVDLVEQTWVISFAPDAR